jgi:hypothetical protein
MSDPCRAQVSSEMEEAGLSVYEALYQTYPKHLLVVEVYKAMRMAALDQTHQPTAEMEHCHGGQEGASK